MSRLTSGAHVPEVSEEVVDEVLGLVSRNLEDGSPHVVLVAATFQRLRHVLHDFVRNRHAQRLQNDDVMNTIARQLRCDVAEDE